MTPMWRPIETAPKDGTAFLAFLPHFNGFVADQRFQRCAWTGWGGGCWDAQFEKGGTGPTHWMPFPDPPENVPRTIPVPCDTNEARLMLNLGLDYLQRHAPHLLTDAGLAAQLVGVGSPTGEAA